MPEHVVEALREEFKTFEKVGLMKTEGENVKVVTKHLRRLNKVLYQGNKVLYQGRGLQKELINCIIRGMLTCSCEAFRDHFVRDQRETLEMLVAYRRNRSMMQVMSQSDIYVAIKLRLEKADQIYETLVYGKLYVNAKGTQLSFMKLTGAPVSSTRKKVCDNCLGEHLVTECELPRDPNAIAKNRKVRIDKSKKEKAEKNEKSSDVPTRDSNGNRSNSSNSNSNNSNSNISRPPRINKNSLKVEAWCSVCKSWCNHSGKYHKQAQKPGFSLAAASPKHPAVLLQATLDAAKATAPAAAAPAPAVPAPAPAAPPAAAPAARTSMAAAFSSFPAKQASLQEAIARNGKDFTLGLEAQSQLTALQAELQSHFG